MPETKVMLVSPPLSTRERMGSLGEAGASMPALGILYLAAQLRKHGYPVDILDAEGLGLDTGGAVEAISRFAPDILGITTTTLSIHNSADLAAAVKARAPETRVVLGGPHVTALPRETMNAFEAVDGCIIGDGEVSFLQVVDNIENGLSMGRDADGFIWREEGAIHFSPKTRHLEDLDTLPMPAWDMLDGFPNRYRPPFHSYHRLPVANIVTSRGCPGVCSFCDRSVFGRVAFSHSVGYIVDMIEHLATRFGIREISIKDDMFVTSRERVLEFCDELGARGLDITWSCNSRVNCVSNDLLKEMKKAGCWMISYGIESGSPRMLKKMMKGISLRQILDALAMTRSNGIVSKGFFLIGIPGETTETLQETFDFIKTIPLDEMNVNFFTPFPGSKLYDEILSEGFTPDFRRMNMLDTVYVPKGLTEKEMRDFQKRMIRAFYVQPGKILLYGGRALTNINELKRLWRCFKLFVALQTSHGGK